jgi:hypothetical protein
MLNPTHIFLTLAGDAPGNVLEGCVRVDRQAEVFGSFGLGFEFQTRLVMSHYGTRYQLRYKTVLANTFLAFLCLARRLKIEKIFSNRAIYSGKHFRVLFRT